MLDLADSVLELHLPIMLVVPKHRDYSFLEERSRMTDEPAIGAADNDQRTANERECTRMDPSRRIRSWSFASESEIVIPG